MVERARQHAALPALADVADAVESGLRQAAERLEAEQAVYGLDSADELALHVVLAEAFARAGYGVHREQRYPADRPKRRFSEGERCDFVLTAASAELSHPDVAGTLFDSPAAVQLCDALWLEVKVVSQFTAFGANPNYASQLFAPVRRDVSKLSKDPGILHAGLVIILFAQDERVADHDLNAWQDECIRRGLPIAAPARRMLGINDRIGNRCCAVAAYPVGHL